MALTEQSRTAIAALVKLCMDNEVELQVRTISANIAISNSYNLFINTFITPDSNIEQVLVKKARANWHTLTYIDNLEKNRFFRRNWVARTENEILAFIEDRTARRNTEAAVVATAVENKRNAVLVEAYRAGLDHTKLFTKIMEETDLKVLISLQKQIPHVAKQEKHQRQVEAHRFLTV